MVGGSVRDLVLGRQPQDLDLEVFGLPPGQLHALLARQCAVQFVGKAFGVFKLEGLPVDISLPSRLPTDHESVPGLLRQADPEMDIDEALGRRDFTINAMAWDPDTLELRDPFNGRADLAAEHPRQALHERGPGRVSPHFVHGRLINLISGQVSIKYGLMGPNHAVVTACSTGAHSIGDAARMIKDGDADIMLAGGSESTVCPIGIAGFAQARALCTAFNDAPEKASRPYDKDRDGFVMGEGAGVVVLEEYEHAKARGAKIYAEVVGYGLSGDAYHVTAPHPEGKGAQLAMEMALRKAGMKPGDIDYVNAHGTSTMADTIELAAVKRVLGDDLSGASMSSTKSAIGHLLGGAGAVEAIFCILAIRDQIVPPTLNLDDPDEGTEGVDLVPHTAKKREVRAALNNSFGFGGTNASLIVKRVD